MAEPVAAGSAHGDLAAHLIEAVPGFADSPELAAVSARRDRLDAVAGALGHYLLRLQRREIRREADASETAALERAYALIEELVQSEDPGVRKVLVDGVLDRLHSDDVVVAVLETRLGPTARSLFRRWAV